MDRIDVLYSTDRFCNYTDEFKKYYKAYFNDEPKQYDTTKTTDKNIIHLYKLLKKKNIINNSYSRVYLFESIPVELVDYLHVYDHELEVDYERLYKELIEDIIKTEYISPNHINKKERIDNYRKNGIY